MTIRVEGKNDTLVAPTKVELPASAFKPDGTHDCAPNSGGGALQVATAGNWKASWFESPTFSAYSLDEIKSEKASGTTYWGSFVNGKYGANGVCDGVLQEGDSLLFYIDDFYGDPYLPLALTATGTPKPGQAFTVKVERLGQDGTRAPVEGATIAGASSATPTNAEGVSTVTLNDAGDATLTATKDKFIRDRAKICATTGDDGRCGTTVPAPAPAACAFTTGDDGRCGTPDKRAALGAVTSVREQQRFKKGKGPRELKGKVAEDPAGIQDIRLRLTRKDGRACSTYDGKRERFMSMSRCGAERGRWFSIGDRQDWAYLLPERVGRGRYVLDLEVVDKAGNRTSLARGSSRVVFTVG